MLGVVEGLTEFLPVSLDGASDGHRGSCSVGRPGVTAYTTAIIQLGAIVATFSSSPARSPRLFMAWVRRLRDPATRAHHDYALAWAVIVNSIPVGIAGFLGGI